MSESKTMRPVVFKGGKDFGKVEGIRGLFRDPSGRWYVRKAFAGSDKQKTLDLGSKTPTFSALERAAEKALKELTREIEASVVDKPTPKDNRSALQKGQDACRIWVEKTYTLEHFARDTVSRRKREADGFAFVTKSLLDHQDEIDEHNQTLASKKFAAYVERGSEVAAVDCVRIIKAIFASAAEEGKHLGLNPGKKLCDIHRKRKDKPDDRFISMGQSAELQAALPQWCMTHHIDGSTATEMQLFFYLLTLGMRPSSAIRFTSTDLMVQNGQYRYRVDNHKAETFMPVSQLLHPFFGEKLKAIPVYERGKTRSSFSHSEDFFCDKLNIFIAERLGEPRIKSLRKGFVTETMNAARSSKDFDSMDARRLTHIIRDVADNNYNCGKQEGSDHVMEWWNREWYNRYQYYASLPENRLVPTKEDDPVMHRRASFEDLSDILD